MLFSVKYFTLVRNLSTIVDWLGAYTDSLYYTKDGNLYTMFVGDALPYHYKSPMLTDGSYSNRKLYKDFYIKYSGDITIKLYVDKELINSKTLTGDKCYNLKALDNSEGYGLEIDIEGTGEVSEIEYKALGRQNGR